MRDASRESDGSVGQAGRCWPPLTTLWDSAFSTVPLLGEQDRVRQKRAGVDVPGIDFTR